METTGVDLGSVTEVLDFFFKSMYLFQKIEGIIFGGGDVFSLPKYLYFVRKIKAPTEQKIFSHLKPSDRKRKSFATHTQMEGTDEKLFLEASSRPPGLSFGS